MYMNESFQFLNEKCQVPRGESSQSPNMWLVGTFYKLKLGEISVNCFDMHAWNCARACDGFSVNKCY